MTLNGYYFTATGITEYGFFHGEREVLRVSHSALPDAPVRITSPSGMEYTLPRPGGWDFLSQPRPGAAFPFLDAHGQEAGVLYLLSPDHFAVAVPGSALTGRVIHERLRRSVCFTGMDDALFAHMEYDFARMPSRERFGEWFPRRYVVDIMKHADETLLTLALSAPFLSFGAIEVG